MKKDNEYLSIPEVARLLGFSRIAIYKKVKKGDIDAIKVGNRYLVSKSHISEIIGEKTSPEKQRIIESYVMKFVKEYKDLIIRLGDE